MQPEEDQRAGERVTRGVLFVDVSDSTGLLRRLGDEGGRRVVLECLDVLEESVLANGGTVIDQIGDELFCSFQDATAVVRAGVELQRALEEARQSGRLPTDVHVRVGLHAGPVVLEGGRLFGETVHVAKRIVGCAKPEQILGTADTLRDVDDLARPPLREMDPVQVKGCPEPIGIVEVLWDETKATIQIRRARPAGPPLDGAELVVSHGALRIVVGPQHTVATLGRGGRNDLIVDHASVSRLHARIERRKSAFVWVDLSTNGSHIVTDGAARRFLRHDEAALPPIGRVELGPPGEAGPDPVFFAIRPCASKPPDPQSNAGSEG